MKCTGELGAKKCEMLAINEILSVVAEPRMGLAALAAFLSFIVQGYSGFGGSIIVIPFLGLLRQLP